MAVALCTLGDMDWSSEGWFPWGNGISQKGISGSFLRSLKSVCGRKDHLRFVRTEMTNMHVCFGYTCLEHSFDNDQLTGQMEDLGCRCEAPYAGAY
jgi:hypothetical protein